MRILPETYITHIHLLEYLFDTLIDHKPVADAIFIKKVHILKPFLNTSLLENLILVHFFQNDLLSHIIFAVFIIIAAVAIQDAVNWVASFASNGMKYWLYYCEVLQVLVVLSELSQKHIGAALG